MTQAVERQASDAARRQAIEAILALYPAISQEQLDELIHWFNREASALDVALVASNEAIRPGYARFRADHIDRLRAKEVFIAAAVGMAVFLLVVWFAVR